MAAVGDTHETQLADDLSRTQIVQYAGASGDYNPLHSDEPFAKEIAGYPTVFAHGMLTMGMTGQALTAWLGDDALRTFGVRFSAQVWPGDRLTARFTVEGEQDGELQIAVSVANQDDREVLVGTATAAATAA
jgi:acyl dehydratase